MNNSEVKTLEKQSIKLITADKTKVKQRAEVTLLAVQKLRKKLDELTDGIDEVKTVDLAIKTLVQLHEYEESLIKTIDKA